MTYDDAIQSIQDMLDNWTYGDVEAQGYRSCPGHMGKMGLHMLNNYILDEQPDVVVETGVNNGASSLIILRAMQEVGRGRLFSIDLPFEAGDYQEVTIDGVHTPDAAWSTVPEGKKPGWLVPEELRLRWTLYLGDSRDFLPGVLSGAKEIDMFLHDSEHTFDHMTWEFETAWPYIKSGGVLACDNADWGASAFYKFCASRVRRPGWITPDGAFAMMEKP